MPSNLKKSNNGDKILQLAKNQREDLVQKLVLEATKPLQSEIVDLKTEVTQLRESQEFLSGQHDSLNKNYSNAVKVNDQEIRKLNQCTVAARDKNVWWCCKCIAIPTSGGLRPPDPPHESYTNTVTLTTSHYNFNL